MTHLDVALDDGHIIEAVDKALPVGHHVARELLVHFLREATVHSGVKSNERVVSRSTPCTKRCQSASTLAASCSFTFCAAVLTAVLGSPDHHAALPSCGLPRQRCQLATILAAAYPFTFREAPFHMRITYDLATKAHGVRCWLVSSLDLLSRFRTRRL